jgi:hypothetical protein
MHETEGPAILDPMKAIIVGGRFVSEVWGQPADVSGTKASQIAAAVGAAMR